MKEKTRISSNIIKNSDNTFRQLSAAVENSPMSIVITNNSGVIEYVNRGFVSMTDYTQDDAVGKKISILNSGEHNKEFYRNLWNVISEGKEWSGEIHNRKKDGSLFWEMVTISPVRDEHGRVTHFIKIGEDVSDKRNMMDLLIRSYEFLESVMDQIQPVFVTDEEGNFFLVNRMFTKITGYSGDEIANKNLTVLFESREQETVARMIESIRNRGASFHGREARLIMKNGTGLTVLMDLNQLERDGKNLYLVGTLQDISERKEAETQLKKLSQAVDQSPASVVITDLEGKIEYVNPKFTRVTGYSLSEAIGENPRILKSGIQTTEFYRDMWKTIIAGKEWHGEFHNLKKNGEPYWESASISPIRNSNGKITHFLAVKEDITSRKLAEEALRESEETLRERNIAMMQDIQYSKHIIQNLFPRKLPRFSNLIIDYRYMPLQAVGGDFFSVTPLQEGGMGVFIGDVSGHGVSAALFLTLVKSATDRICRNFGLDPVRYIRELNTELFENMFSYFVTALYGYFNLNSREMSFTFSKGGHPSPILYRAADGTVDMVDAKGKPLGLFKEVNYQEKTVTLFPGDRLYLYTDGIIETMDENGELLGFERLIDLISEWSNSELTLSLSGIINGVNQFRGTVPIDDDIILLGFEIS